jgi:hypothetical protein
LIAVQITGVWPAGTANGIGGANWFKTPKYNLKKVKYKFLSYEANRVSVKFDFQSPQFAPARLL